LLDILNGVAAFDVQCDRLAREGLDEDLHSTHRGCNNLPLS
jgi:hypothetical protein